MAAPAGGLIYRLEGTVPWFAKRGPAAGARVFLLCGNDPVTADEVKRKLIERERENGELDLVLLDAAVDAPVTIADALRETPLFASRRALVIRRAEKLANEQNHPGLAEQLRAVDESLLVILLSEESGATLTKKAFFAPLVKNGAAACFYAPLDEADAVRWLRAYCARRRITIGADEAKRVVEIVGLDPGELAQEIAKVTAAAGPAIDRAAIAEHLEPHRQWTSFEWADAVLGRRRDAVAMAARASDNGRECIGVITALNWRLESIEQMRRGDRSMSPMARRGVEPYAAKWPASRIAAARRILLRLNRDVISLPGAAHLARIELATLRLLMLR